MTLHSISGLFFTLLTLYFQQGWFETHVTLERVIYWASLIALGVTSYYGLRGKKAEAIAKTDSMTINSQQTLINTRDRELIDKTGLLEAKTQEAERLAKELKTAQDAASAIKTEYMALASLDVSTLLNFEGLKKELTMTQMRESSCNSENVTLQKRVAQLERQIRALDHIPVSPEGGSLP
jgi:hypothetical protein